jgi:sugar transferase (PEP-CTERM system associated)
MHTADQNRANLGTNATGADGTALPSYSGLGLVSRNYNKTLIGIGGHYFPRESLRRAFEETLLLMGSLLAATLLRFPHVAASYAFLSDRHNWYRFALVTFVCQLAFYCNDLYDLKRATRSRSLLLIRLARALGISFLALAISYYVFPDIRLERGIVALTVPLVMISTLACRLAIMTSTTSARPVERVLILGTGIAAANVASEIMSRPELQYKIVGFLGDDKDAGEKPLVFPGIIGAVSELDQIVHREHVDLVVLSLAERRGVLPFADLVALKLQGLPIEEAQSIFARLTGRIMLEQLRPSWLIVSEGFNKSRWLLAAKRVTDIVISLLLIAITLPLMLAVALAIVLESGAPVFFRQERVGLGGRTFNILKFRSMQQEEGKAKPSWTSDDDPRITRVGRLIRKSRLDELPQLINILRGEMSLVGPRPEVPYFCELLEKQIPFFNQRHAVRPGLTGWAQVKYQYGATLEEAKTKFEFDLFYIQNLSPLLDIAIIFETVRVVLWGRGAK